MKIRTKISLFYTVISICIVTIVILVFYFFTSHYITKLYNSYLMEKTYLTAQKYWEKDEVDEFSYQIIEQKYNELLPQANEILLNADSIQTVKDTLNKYLSENQQERLFADMVPITFTYKGETGAALYYPDNEGNFIVLVTSLNTYGKELQTKILYIAISVIIISAIFIFFIGRFYSGNILLPLKHILKELKRIRGNNIERRIKYSGNNDELDDLSHSLNDMLDRIDTAFQAEKSFVSNASHELNNPVTAIQGECEITLMKDRSTNEYIESLQRISTESQRLSLLIKNLLFLSRHEHDFREASDEKINLKELLEELVNNNSRVIFKYDEENSSGFLVKGNAYLMRVAIQNILENAYKYSDREIEVVLSSDSKETFIDITDYGIGIPKEEIQHICQSFYRGSNTRNHQGQGIGLSLTLKILSVFGVKMEIDSQVNSYTHIRLTYI